MKLYIKLFEEFIAEGGWATTKTQGTSITPDVIGEVVKLMEKISKGFNQHLASIGLPPLDFVRPIGSGTWWTEDLENQPDKTYGDVDYLVGYPTLALDANERNNEISSTKLYNSEFMDWLKSAKIPEVDLEESQAVSSDASLKLILEVAMRNGGVGYVQVDLVVTPQEYTQWTLFRMTPIRNVKGFVLGNLYSSLGEVLDISIQARGVRAKFNGQVMAPYSKRAGVDDILITADAQNFIRDIGKFFWEQSGTSQKYEPASRLANWRGMNANSPKFEDLCEGIRGLGETLEQLGEFGTTIKYKSADEFYRAVVARYEEKMMKMFNASKFNKAESPEAIKTIEKVRKVIQEYVALAKSLLK